jgi:hypothetical protein
MSLHYMIITTRSLRRKILPGLLTPTLMDDVIPFIKIDKRIEVTRHLDLDTLVHEKFEMGYVHRFTYVRLCTTVVTTVHLSMYAPYPYVRL